MGFIETFKGVFDPRRMLKLEREVHEADRKLRERDRRIEELEDQLRDKRRFVFRENCRWDSETNEGPFCSACYDSNKKTIQMHVNRGIYSCPVCKKVVLTEAERRRTDALIRAHNENGGRDPVTGY